LGDVAHESNLVDVGSIGVDGCLIMMANSNKKKVLRWYGDVG
jgi:hypothetical protein